MTGLECQFLLETVMIAHHQYVRKASPDAKYKSFASSVDFCRNGMCSNTSITPLGNPCQEDQDCKGAVYGRPAYCSALGRCGGSGAMCTADDEKANRYTQVCVSGMWLVPQLIHGSLSADKDL